MKQICAARRKRKSTSPLGWRGNQLSPASIMDHLTGFNSLVTVTTGINNVIHWCQQSFQTVRNGVERVRSVWVTQQQYRQQLQETLRRVQELERELQAVRQEKVHILRA
ncbi:uncharacterized protein LOC124266105 [Haliotis rubra]|uniref:uncharacterized protein LOC124266105 n=1 Tax=Haliotis rubra TaxID=36100 RepID=UPI001EE5AB8A|nr:uncharacterized protein LOC124266105 [Haliotis rubra]